MEMPHTALKKGTPMSHRLYISLSVATLGLYMFYFHFVLIQVMEKKKINGVEYLKQYWRIYISMAAMTLMLLYGWSLSSALLIPLMVSSAITSHYMSAFAYTAFCAIREHYKSIYGVTVKMQASWLIWLPGLGLVLFINQVLNALSYKKQRNLLPDEMMR